MARKGQLHLGAFMRPATIHTGGWRYPNSYDEDNFNFEDDYGLARGWDCKRCGKAFEEDESYLLVDHAKTHGITIYGMDSLEEKLNKDGTGVRRATRGLNPKKTKAQVLQFVYVSKSECEICRQYDGMAFATDSPNRPIIPRLESQGKRGSRPYTHPNCKCKWVRPFSDAGIKNFDEIGMKDSDNINFLETSNETYESVKASLYDYAHKKYGKKFDRLPKSRKHYILMQELMKQLKSDEALDPTSLPIASMLKMTYDAIQPTLALRLAKMTHKHTNEVRDLIDDMVGESLSSERKHDIVLEHNLDFTFENLLELTTLALFEAYSDEHDVWDEEKNKLVDPSLLEDKEESKEGWTVPNSWDQSAPDEDEMQELERVESMDIEDGDLVDFGGYGRLYVLNVNYGSGWGGRNVDFWVTEDEEDRFDSNARPTLLNCFLSLIAKSIVSCVTDESSMSNRTVIALRYALCTISFNLA